MKKVKRLLCFLLIKIIYFWGCIWYDKKYLTGKLFDKWHYTIGWRLIIKYWFPQKVLGYARHVNWPIARGVNVAFANNVIFDNNDIDNFGSTGCYFQGSQYAKVYIGKGTKIAPNCGFITANHDVYDLDKHVKGEDIVLGENCWIGMNSMVLPGVVLGNHTIVGAGSVVTKSFPEGNVIIAGNPAKIIRKL